MFVERAFAGSDAAHFEPVRLLGLRHRQVVVDVDAEIAVLVPDLTRRRPGQVGRLQYPQSAIVQAQAVRVPGRYNFCRLVGVYVGHDGPFKACACPARDFIPNAVIRIDTRRKGRTAAVNDPQKRVALGNQFVQPIVIEIESGNKTNPGSIVRWHRPPVGLAGVQRPGIEVVGNQVGRIGPFPDDLRKVLRKTGSSVIKNIGNGKFSLRDGKCRYTLKKCDQAVFVPDIKPAVIGAWAIALSIDYDVGRTVEVDVGNLGKTIGKVISGSKCVEVAFYFDLIPVAVIRVEVDGINVRTGGQFQPVAVRIAVAIGPGQQIGRCRHIPVTGGQGRHGASVPGTFQPRRKAWRRRIGKIEGENLIAREYFRNAVVVKIGNAEHTQNTRYRGLAFKPQGKRRRLIFLVISVNLNGSGRCGQNKFRNPVGIDVGNQRRSHSEVFNIYRVKTYRVGLVGAVAFENVQFAGRSPLENNFRNTVHLGVEVSDKKRGFRVNDIHPAFPGNFCGKRLHRRRDRTSQVGVKTRAIGVETIHVAVAVVVQLVVADFRAGQNGGANFRPHQRIAGQNNRCISQCQGA